ncbi:MAG: AAA family ATPase, partial [Defluviitaleaceae bacterium]|nr:AAA family ATPase [Defluviitaleaceae bacterium]
MLTNLLINNVALIDEAEINFGAGLNILTGETGAGKSMLIDSINFMLGGRPGKDFIRNGAETAFVEGLFEINSNIVKKQIAELGIELNGENQLHISRSINNSGKNVCRINGRAAAVGMLKETSALLVDVHGQHEHQSLLNVNRHIHFLDAFCGDKLTILKSKLNECLIKYRDTIKKLNELTGGSRGEEQAEIWRYQINEIKQAKLLNGEEERLNAKRKRLGGVEKLARFAAEALDLLRGGDSNTAASDQIGRALYCLAEIEKLDAEKKELADTLGDAASIVSDVVRELREYADSLDADPAELELIESRLDVIYRLKNKYGSTVADVLAHCEKISGRLEQYENSGILIKENETLKRKQTQEIIEICKCMSSIRTEKAGQIKKQIETVLKSLGIDHAVFEIKIDKKKEFNSNGNDRAE